MTSSFAPAKGEEAVVTAITIFATFVPKPGCEAEVQHALQAVVPPTRDEPGCLRFDLYVGRGPDMTFRMFEIFASQQALDAHRETGHYRAYRATVMPLLELAPVVVTMAPLDAASHVDMP
ncbi:putative quinol monooxygenase [Paraburkholderia sp. DHOC27]|uniref:putative quinol monooxygenase n=1 Tax=Paraburkholderia sp. DHOC27 TaxID=2303330 RepID=UPI000E3D2900|nr:putative quinol monooxygenase [Paraburkholderia sp. DHOC27]RFU44755.1 antibiotic biosynthesis monooxygenase [Paraburkholderia sp. DHOC27]